MKYLLIGRPNVGKTSVFNKLTISKNIIHKQEGTTRDWHKSNIKGLNYSIIIDSPGVFIKKNKSGEINFSKLLINVDVFLYVIDLKSQNNAFDKESINELRKFNKKILLIINKDDNFEQNSIISKLGFDNLFYVSCSHNLGFDNLYSYLEKNDFGEPNDYTFDYSIAIYGKPNAGKSTLANSLLGYKRIHTSKLPGTTSDVVEDIYKYKNKNFKIIDTAGIFKKNKINIKSINFEAIRKSLNLQTPIDLNIILIDCNEGFDTQIKKILKILIYQSKSIIIVFNKIDIIQNKSEFSKETKLFIKETFSQIKNISTLFISAKNKKHVIRLQNLIFIKSTKTNIFLSTSKINAWLKKSSLEYPHPLIRGRVVNFKYAVQISPSPITIKIFSNFPKKIKKNYKTYLVNNFIKTFKIEDTKINLIFTSARNPFN